MTAERSLKKQHPRQVAPVETRPANTTESALWTRHTSFMMAKLGGSNPMFLLYTSASASRRRLTAKTVVNRSV